MQIQWKRHRNASAQSRVTRQCMNHPCLRHLCPFSVWTRSSARTWMPCSTSTEMPLQPGNALTLRFLSLTSWCYQTWTGSTRWARLHSQTYAWTVRVSQEIICLLSGQPQVCKVLSWRFRQVQFGYDIICSVHFGEKSVQRWSEGAAWRHQIICSNIPTEVNRVSAF